MTPPQDSSNVPRELLVVRGIEKAFFGVKVLKGISFSVKSGDVIGLVGENGAGKSTLVNILGGNLQPEAGSLRFADADYSPRGPQDAARCGIAFIHQELNLFPNLTIAENIFLTRFPRLRATPWIRRGQLHERTAELLREVGLEVPPDRLVETLSAGERQLVEIAKALSIEARLIILDEPTTSLSERETARLFALMGRLRASGLAMIYISHALADVFRLCDDLVVLRDGEVVASGPTETFTTERLVSLMVGRTLHQLFPVRRAAASDTAEKPAPILEVRGVSEPGKVEDVSFDLHRGEVLGLSGLMGAGRSELARMLFGLDGYDRGEVRLAGEAIDHLSPRQLIERGMAFLTENRRSEGLCLDASVADNLTLITLPRHGRTFLRWISRESCRSAVANIRSVVQLDPKTSETQQVRTLSGGNQQKVVLGKWLLSQPKVLILDEPTRGIDVGAKFEIYRLIHQLADQGAGVLVISSEIEELIGLCDRILVMCRGRLSDDVPRSRFDRERILAAALGTTKEATR